MAQVNTRLGLVMEQLNVTGKTLALEIGTDITTVSKWKNGQRKLKFRSKYAMKVADYFLSAPFTYQQKQLLANLEASGYAVPFETMAAFNAALRAWLTEDIDFTASLNAEEDDGEQVTVGVHTGYDGWQHAMHIFWGTLYKLPPGQRVYIGDFGDIQWDDVDPDALKSMIENILKVVSLGHKVVIIDYMTDSYRPYVVILRWLPVYLSKNVEVRYIYKNTEEVYNEGIYLIENQMTLIGMSIDHNHANHIALIHKDAASIEFYGKAMRAIMARSHQLIYVSDLKNPSDMLNIMETHFKEKQVTYMINQMPTFRNMPIDLLKEVLDDNDVADGIQALCLEANRKRRTLRSHCHYVQIYNLDALELAAGEAYVVDYDLSIIVGKEIRISKKHFHQQLAYLTTIKNSEAYTMVLTSFRNLNLNVDKSCISVQDDSIVIAWNPERFDRAIYCRELTVIGGYFQYLKDIWNQIPPISKNDHWRNKQLYRLLED
jgi:transcriptional regulator with XRE-family HTH domain